MTDPKNASKTETFAETDERAEYEQFLAQSQQRSIFGEGWWLDITAGAAGWRPNIVRDKKGRVEAAWPLPTRKTKFGLVAHGAPYTPFVGPQLGAVTSPRAAEQTSRDVSAITALSEALKDAGYCHVEASCMPEFSYWTPLHWSDYTQTTRTTWRIKAGQGTEQLRANLRAKTRGKLNAAQRNKLEVSAGNVSDLITACAATFARQKTGKTPAETVLTELATEALNRERGEIISIHTDDGELVSAGFFVWDDRYTYNLANGLVKGRDSTGAATLLIWHAMLNAMQRGTGFDFEGSMLKPVEQFVRGFGGDVTPYSVVKYSAQAWAKHVNQKRLIKRLLRRT